MYPWRPRPWREGGGFPWGAFFYIDSLERARTHSLISCHGFFRDQIVRRSHPSSVHSLFPAKSKSVRRRCGRKKKKEPPFQQKHPHKGLMDEAERKVTPRRVCFHFVCTSHSLIMLPCTFYDSHGKKKTHSCPHQKIIIMPHVGPPSALPTLIRHSSSNSI